MKKNFSAYVLAVLAICILTVVGCKKDDDTNNDGKPTACISSASTATVGTAIAFTSCSTDGQGYSWDFGVAGTTTDVSPAQNPSYTYTAAGTYTVTLTVVNTKGTSTTTKTITVTTGGGGGTATAADYSGTWAVAQGACNGQAPYLLSISSSGNSITVQNFNDGGQALGASSITGTVNGNSVSFAQQNVGATPSFIAATTGTLSSNKQTLTIPFTVNDGSGNTLSCTIVATKQ